MTDELDRAAGSNGDHHMKLYLSIAFCLLTFVRLFTPIPAFAGDYSIVPGQRIGSIALGMSESEVHSTLHAPEFHRRLLDSTIEESWSHHLTPAQMKSATFRGLYWYAVFVDLYYQHGKVVQVEVNSPRFHTNDNLSVASPASSFESRYRPFVNSDNPTTGPLLYTTLDQAGGIPAFKHYVTIEDSIRYGIAWRFGAWGDLAPDPNRNDQEVIIVHRLGARVILEPDASNRFVVTEKEKTAAGLG